MNERAPVALTPGLSFLPFAIFLQGQNLLFILLVKCNKMLAFKTKPLCVPLLGVLIACNFNYHFFVCFLTTCTVFPFFSSLASLLKFKLTSVPIWYWCWYFCGFIFSCFLCNNNNETKTMLWVIMVDNTWNSRISLRWISGQTPWWVVAYSPLPSYGSAGG